MKNDGQKPDSAQLVRWAFAYILFYCFVAILLQETVLAAAPLSFRPLLRFTAYLTILINGCVGFAVLFILYTLVRISLQTTDCNLSTDCLKRGVIGYLMAATAVEFWRFGLAFKILHYPQRVETLEIFFTAVDRVHNTANWPQHLARMELTFIGLGPLAFLIGLYCARPRPRISDAAVGAIALFLSLALLQFDSGLLN
ncbi:hypothetical protein JW992_09135 [candidate division KSB1 bacterium]|nr:hypothetical protein [candidate division KSB1 bacterium]